MRGSQQYLKLFLASHLHNIILLLLHHHCRLVFHLIPICRYVERIPPGDTLGPRDCQLGAALCGNQLAVLPRVDVVLKVFNEGTHVLGVDVRWEHLLDVGLDDAIHGSWDGFLGSFGSGYERLGGGGGDVLNLAQGFEFGGTWGGGRFHLLNGRRGGVGHLFTFRFRRFVRNYYLGLAGSDGFCCGFGFCHLCRGRGGDGFRYRLVLLQRFLLQNERNLGGLGGALGGFLIAWFLNY
ncbi:hypothetical protein WDU94_001069 [Cyamophila willieti]